MDVESRIRDGRMTRFQALTVFVCMLTVISDGYDILAVSLAIPYFSGDWNLQPSDIGYVVSASTAGMVVGALVLAPMGDRFGRRLMGLVGQALVTVGMFLAWLAPGLETLLGARFITGIGIGAVTAVMGVIVAEFSTTKWLGFNMAAYSAGTGLGGFLAGVIAATAIPMLGWKSMFLIGTIINVVILLICVIGLPESIQFLSTRFQKRSRSLEKVNRLLARMGREPIADLPASPPPGKTSPRVGLRELVSPKVLRITLLLAASYCLIQGWFYFNLGWTPQLITTATSDPALGTLFGTLAPLGGMIGGLLYGFISLKIANKPLTVTALFVTALGAGLLGYFLSQQDIPLFIPLGMAIGYGAALGGMYTLIPASYPTRMRASAFGWISGLGRIAATVGPILAGYLMEGGWTGSALFLGSAVILAVAAALVIPVRPRYEDPQDDDGTEPTGSDHVANADADRDADVDVDVVPGTSSVR
ncbi:MFS transporter [Citricoccus sp. GCM10030269]|uniref:MFS transporter n=1 Tax=Citricoccus sp. GCM10030269 TaxID=3273388 RepID=UPI00361CDDE0